MAAPGWLKIGMWLRIRETPEVLVKVTKISRDFTELRDDLGDIKCRVRTSSIQDFYLSPIYFECDDCCRDNSTTHCGPCLRRKCAFSISGNLRCELPHRCSRAFRGYPESKLPMDLPKMARPRVIPTRYERKWVI